MEPTNIRHKSSNNLRCQHIGTISPYRINYFTKCYQKIIFYGRPADPTMLVALSSLSVAQLQGTQATMYSLIWFLDYMATYVDSMARFYALDMVLTRHIEASYISESKACSRSGGHF